MSRSSLTRGQLNAYLQRFSMVGSLSRESGGNPGGHHRLRPGKTRGDLPGFVCLDSADKMPPGSSAQSGNFGQGFLQVIFPKMFQSGVKAAAHRCQRLPLADRHQGDICGVAAAAGCRSLYPLPNIQQMIRDSRHDRTDSPTVLCLLPVTVGVTGGIGWGKKWR